MRDRPPRLARLEIEELFGPGTPRIDIAFRLDERLTVLHGRNGSGKTVTLRLLDAICSGNVRVFHELPIKLFRLSLDDGSTLEIVEREGKKWFRSAPPGGGTSSGASAQEFPLDEREDVQDRDDHRARTLDMIAALHREQERLEDHARSAGPTERRLLLRQLERVQARRASLAHSRSQVYWHGRFAMDRPDEDSLLSALPRRVPATKLIPTQRLTHWRAPKRSNDGHPPAMVHHLGEQLSREIKAADREYREISTRLDSSLPRRIFEVQKANCPALENLRARYETIREREEQLHRIGLIRDLPEPMGDGRFTEEHRATLSVILEDREAKLEPFRRIGERTELLLKMINAKLQPKTVTLDATRGYQVLSPSGEPFDLSLLSSGEQHELVLLHELLFDVEPGTLILIDEPELSLHVTWQEQVIPDLLEIAEVADLDFVLATHSPYIVGDREDLMERIGEPLPGAEAAK